MKWWHVLVILVDSYLLLSLGPWIVLQTLEWLMSRSGRVLAHEGERLRALTEMEREQVAAWPEKPRPGRYEEPDRLARQSLTALRQVVDEAGSIWPLVSGYNPPALGLVDVLVLRSWQALPRALAAWGNVHALWRLLDSGDQALVTLMEQQQVIEDIPARVRAALNDARAEIRRLSAFLEAEQAAGTSGLDAIAQRLQEHEDFLTQALDRLAEATPDQRPLVVLEIDEVLRAAAQVVEESDQLLNRAVEERSKAQGLMTRIESTLRLAQERWEGLKSRGATEPSLSRSLAELRTNLQQSMGIATQRTVNAYQQVNAQVAVIDGQIAEVMSRLDALDAAIVRSKEAIEGDVAALAQAQKMCDELARQDPLLECDQSLALIEKATQAYLEAERQRGLGTFQGYEASVTQAELAMKQLVEAQQAAAALPERATQVREHLATLAGEATGDWRARAERVREQLRLYARHWTSALAGDAAEALSSLDQVEVDLERIPQNVRYQRGFHQSELAEAADTLAHARESMERAKQLLAKLEAEQQRLEGLRRDAVTAVEKLARESIPETEQLSEKMLPELQQRFSAFAKTFSDRAEAIGDVARTDYDVVMAQWLPSVWQQLDELREEHDRSVREYAQGLKEATARLERQWTRLNKLNPAEPPSSEEHIDRLAKDLEAWRNDSQRQKDSPLLLRDIVGRRASALEQRIETARQQIVEGRRTLSTLDHQYARHSQAVGSLRDAITGMQAGTRWTQLTWDVGEPEKAWERASELERKSRVTATLMEAVDLLQQAVNAAQQAEQLYARVEHQMGSALRRLDDELKAATGALAKVRRRADELRAAGASDELTALDAQCASAERALQMADAATTFEDALRHIRGAREALVRF